MTKRQIQRGIGVIIVLAISLNVPNALTQTEQVASADALPMPLQRDVSFTNHVITTTNTPKAVYVADIDGDGDADVASTSHNGDIAWHENDGDSPPAFTSHVITAAHQSASIYGADIDGDGDIDLVSVSAYDLTVDWYENVNSGSSFISHNIATNVVGALWCYAADVDGDGDMDVLSASTEDDTIAWYENNGTSSPSFTEHVITTNTNHARSVHAADVDGDGDIDVLSASSLDNKIAWYENDGASPPSFTPHTITTSAADAKSVYTADLDKDGDMDVLSASRNDNKIAWYENDGASPPSFTSHIITTGASGTETVYAADIDSDGDVDILSGSRYVDRVDWYENDGNAPPTFAAHTITTSADSVWHVIAADVDGDGDMDVLSASEYDNKVAWYENTMAHCSASFRFGHTVTTNAAGNKTVHAADVDSDGDIDVLSASSPNDNVDEKIAWYENTPGDGSAWAGRIIYAANQNDSSVYTADLDNDGDLDVLSTSIDDNRVSWYENDGASPPSFTPYVITTTHNAYSVHAADIDDDGDLDVLSASYSNDTVAWYENDGASPPSFTSHIIATDADSVRHVYSADVDGDGDIDVLSASQADDKIAWYENDGASSPTFTPHIVTTAADDARWVHVGDVDRDGDMDIVSASYGDSKIAWYENDGAVPPAFTPYTITTTANHVRSVHARDMDNDGDLDLLSSSDEGLVPTGEIIWYENDGSSMPLFTTHVITTGLVGAKNVYAEDIDGDGDQDVIAGSTGDDIAWWENTACDASIATFLVAVPNTLTLYPGDLLDVDLDIQDADALYAAQTECGVDPAILEPQSAIFGDFFDPVNRLVAANEVSSTLGTWLGAISQQNPAGPLSGDGNLATITYQALAPGTTDIICDPIFSDRDGFTQTVSFTGDSVTVLPYATISGTVTYQGRLSHVGIIVDATGPVTQTDTTDGNGDFVLGQLRTGTYTITADVGSYLPACTPVTLVAGDKVTLPTTRLLGGDLNDDGTINIGDATLLTANFGETVPPGNMQADINTDNVVNVQDLAILAGNYEKSGCQAW